MARKTLKTADVKFREDLYPRIDTNAAAVAKYAETLDVLPPIEVNQHDELIDGWHRWTAHKTAEKNEITVTVTETRSDAHLLELAIERNASFGLQLSQDDKRAMARRIYHETDDRERDAKKKHLAKILSVSERTIRDWLSRIDKDTKEARDKKIFSMWLGCHTQEEIAGSVGLTSQATGLVLKEKADLPKLSKPAADHLTDFDVPLFNVWKFKEKSNAVAVAGLSGFGFLRRVFDVDSSRVFGVDLPRNFFEHEIRPYTDAGVPDKLGNEAEHPADDESKQETSTLLQHGLFPPGPSD